MARPRFQRGRVEETGKRLKQWRGHYYVYITDPDGEVTRHHRTLILGTRAELRTKHEARAKLQEIIERDTQQSTEPGRVKYDATVAWFAEEVFVKLKRSRWGAKAASNNLMVLEHHILPVLGLHKLDAVTPVMVQSMLDEKAKSRVPVKKGGKVVLTDRTYSRSLVTRMYILTNAIFQEAVEQDYIRKNPCVRVEAPPTPKPQRPALSEEQIAALLDVLGQRDRLIVRLLSICALRAGELFALRWGYWEPDRQILNAHGTKTEGSDAPVVLTKSLNEEVSDWCRCQREPQDENLIFPSENGTAILPGNFLKRVLKPAAKKVGIPNVTLHMFRRSYPTIGQHGGSVKDLQTQLRHAKPDMTAGVYMQPLDPGVRATAEFVEEQINKARKAAIVGK